MMLRQQLLPSVRRAALVVRAHGITPMRVAGSVAPAARRGAPRRPARCRYDPLPERNSPLELRGFDGRR